jgi:hypothetical protein
MIQNYIKIITLLEGMKHHFVSQLTTQNKF